MWKETRKMYGKEAAEYFEAVELKRPYRIALRCDGTKGTTGKDEFVYTYQLAPPIHNFIEITLSGEINRLTGITKLFGKKMAGTIKKLVEKF